MTVAVLSSTFTSTWSMRPFFLRTSLNVAFVPSSPVCVTSYSRGQSDGGSICPTTFLSWPASAGTVWNCTAVLSGRL